MNILDLFEAPIEDLSFIGNWGKNASFKHAQDRNLLNNPKAQEKIIHKWQNTKVPFNIYMVNSPGAGKVAEKGIVDVDWLHDNLKPNVVKQIKINPNAINIIYTGNNADQRVPMTAWVMAHRFGHAVARPDSGGYGRGMQYQVWAFGEARNELLRYTSMILEQAYGISGVPDSQNKYTGSISFQGDMYARNQKLLLGFFKAIGTMRSAREKELRDEFEFLLELLAQYMITSNIKFNPLPDRFRYGNDTAYFRDKNMTDYYNGLLEELAADVLPSLFDNIMDSCVGKILVM